MERFAGDLSLMLLAGTPFLVLAKLVHTLAVQRLSFARSGSRRARVELVAWLLLVAVDSHTLALWSSFANQPEDLCSKYGSGLGEHVYISRSDIFDYPVSAQCVWQGRESVNITPWPLNVVTALFVVAAAAVVVYAYRRRDGVGVP